MRTSVSLSGELAAYVDEHFSPDAESDAQAIRDAVRHAKDLDERVADLEATIDEQAATIDELETELERVKREKRQILEQREEHTDLVRAVEHERTLQERRAQAGIATRAKWWLFGMDTEESDES